MTIKQIEQAVYSAIEISNRELTIKGDGLITHAQADRIVRHMEGSVLGEKAAAKRNEARPRPNNLMVPLGRPSGAPLMPGIKWRVEDHGKDN